MRTFFLFLSCFIAISSLKAQQKNAQSVATAVEQLRLAMIGANADSLSILVVDELSYGHSNGFVEGKQSFIDKIVSGKSDFLSIELSNQTIDISGKLAIVRHQLAATTNDGGIAGTVKLKILLVYQFKKGRWLLFARQAVKY